MDQKQKKDKTERVTGLGRRTREETKKWDQTDSPGIPDSNDKKKKTDSLRGTYYGGTFDVS